MFRSSQTAFVPSSTALEYAPAPPRGHRVLRRVTWCVFGLAVGTFAIVWGWRFAAQLHYVWMQHQLVKYHVPDGPMRIGSNAQIENATTWPVASQIIPRHEQTWVYPVFIHERIARNGESRLIVVEELAMPGGFTTQLR